MKMQALTKTYGKRTVLNMPAYEFAPGMIYAVIGANGSGKSTLARVLAGIEKADQKKKPFGEESVEVGYSPQRAYAFRMSAEANIKLAGDDNDRAKRLMEELQIAHLRKERADRLSGGEKARVAMARIMMKDHDLLILDEPTASMDMESTILAEELIRAYRERTGAVILLITHSLAQAARLADRPLFLDNGELIEEEDTNELIHQPKQPQTRRFIEVYG